MGGKPGTAKTPPGGVASDGHMNKGIGVWMAAATLGSVMGKLALMAGRSWL